MSNFTQGFAATLNAIGRAIAPRWLLINVGGSGTGASPVIQRVQGYFDEFEIRAMGHNYQQFEQVAALVSQRNALKSPAPYAVLDSYPDGGSITDPRTQLATLAYYYLLSDPVTTFLDVFGGAEPVMSIAFSPDDSFLLAGRADGTIELLTR